MAAIRRPVFGFSVLYVASNFGALMDARRRVRMKEDGRRTN
jgi:hypothetical protein